ncbi:DUF1345 domain-containing protein [Amnibacterium kyonggiense]
MPADDESHRMPYGRRSYVGIRILIAAIVGLAVGVAVAVASRALYMAPTAGWIAFSIVFLAVTWRVIGGMDATRTAGHATREDPTTRAGSIILIVASLASLGGVALLLVGGQQGSKVLEPALAVASVALSWLLVHSLYTLKYAALYYTGRDGGVDFNQRSDPDYQDFAYLALTLGMTYQVSDTSITSRDIRHAALRHGLLSYLLGAVVLASTINLVAGLAK